MKARGRILVELAQNASSDTRLLHLPKYETTKGLCRDDIEKFLQQKWNSPFKLPRREVSETPVAVVAPYENARDACTINNYFNPEPLVARGSLPSTHIIPFNHVENDIPLRNSSSLSFVSPAEGISSDTEYIPSSVSISDTSNTCEDEIGDIFYDAKKNNTKRKLFTNPLPEKTTITASLNCLNPASIKNRSLIQIHAAEKCDTKRVRNKYHSCYFCQKHVIYITKHLDACHNIEKDIQKLQSLPKGSKQRREGYGNLMRAGDFYHNANVLALKDGDLLLSRRPTPKEILSYSYIDYGPCPQCLAFMLKKHLWRHRKKACSINLIKKHYIEKCFNRDIISESEALLHNFTNSELSLEFTINITSKMRNDDISECCKSNNLILKFGAMQFDKYGTTQCELIRQSMRQLARLALKLQELYSLPITLADFLVPEKFDYIVRAVKDLCNAHEKPASRTEFGIPSLALKLGHSLRKCVAIERGIALRNSNLKRDQMLKTFLELMDMEWHIRISCNALSTMYKNKLNATTLLPLTEDLVKLSKFLEGNIRLAQKKLTEHPTAITWNRLAILVLCRIILFNKRRSGEASRMLITQYQSKPEWKDQTTQELRGSLTSLEKHLASRLCIVEIGGKRGRKVALILTPEIKAALDHLIDKREQCGISNSNPYIFANLMGNSHLRGHVCIQKICVEANLESPSTVTGTKLRKYVATVCQIFNLTETEIDWLARHLGHDIRVHREFYRLHESAVELTKVSRLLIAIDNGQAHQFSGKKLDEIGIKDLPALEEDVEIADAEDNDSVMVDNEGVAQKLHEIDEINSPILSSAKKTTTIDKPKPSVKKIPTKRVCWSTEEKAAVLKFFKIQIKNNVVPNKDSVEKCKEQFSSILERRSWREIKYCVYNHLKMLKKFKK